MSLFSEPIFWFLISGFCLVEGMLFMLGKAKSLSSLSRGKYRDHPKLDEYVRKDGVGSFCIGLIILVCAFLVTKQMQKAALILAVIAVILYFCFEIYLSIQISKE